MTIGIVEGSLGCGWFGSGIVKGSGDGSFDIPWQYPVDDVMERVSAPHEDSSTDTWTDSWSRLESPMRLALQLAWDSCRAGSFGIGAVITAADGTASALADTLVASGELIALAGSTSAVDEVGARLWERLGDCVDEVRRLGADTGQAWP